MKKSLKSIKLIINWNSLLVVVLAIGATYASIIFDVKVNFPLTIIGIAVVFPIVFSIGGAYSRREKALEKYGDIKALGRSMFFSSRDWIKDSGEIAEKSQQDFKDSMNEIFKAIRSFFQTEDSSEQTKREEKIYTLFSKLSLVIEGLRERGLSGSEVSRVNSHLSKMIMSFESLKHIFQYRTPRTLRSYSKLFIYVVPIVYAPYFALLGENQNLLIAFIMPTLFALIFTSLDNIQEHLENPFDQIGEDDIKINAEKYTKSLDL
jgi:predicted membrane chloride channel (bestrophin family)